MEDSRIRHLTNYLAMFLETKSTVLCHLGDTTQYLNLDVLELSFLETQQWTKENYFPEQMNSA